MLQVVHLAAIGACIYVGLAQTGTPDAGGHGNRRMLQDGDPSYFHMPEHPAVISILQCYDVRNRSERMHAKGQARATQEETSWITGSVV